MITSGNIVCISRNKELKVNGELKYEYSFIPAGGDKNLIQGSLTITLSAPNKFEIGQKLSLGFNEKTEEELAAEKI